MKSLETMTLEKNAFQCTPAETLMGCIMEVSAEKILVSLRSEVINPGRPVTQKFDQPCMLKSIFSIANVNRRSQHSKEKRLHNFKGNS